MELPVFEGRRVALISALPETPERLARIRDRVPLALDEEHRRVERPLDVVVNPRLFCPEWREEARAIGIYVEPYAAAIRQPSVRAPLLPGAVRKHRSGRRGEREGDPHFPQGVGL